MAKLHWVSDNDLDRAVDRLRQFASKAAGEAKSRRRRNVVDPFLSLLIASTLDVTKREDLMAWQDNEAGLRGLSGALGPFHEDILSSVTGWVKHDAGYDLESAEHRLLAEVKNKHNTMNASNRQQVVTELDTAVRQKGSGWKGYLVLIIPRKPVRYESRLPVARPVFETDGASFYHKATGDPDAIHDLFDVLCDELTDSWDIAEYCRSLMLDSIPPRTQGEDESAND